jgi:hypothetical protein
MHKLKPVGKSCFIWKPKQVNKGDVVKIADRLEAAGVTTAVIKFSDGWYEFPDAEIGPTINELRKRGISVAAWSYLYLKFYTWGKEAAAMVNTCKRYQPDFLLIDAEGECKNQHTRAKVFAPELRNGLPDLPIGLCSFWKPTYHPEVPWAILRGICDFDAPQVYWRGWNPVGKLLISKKEYGAMLPKLPFSLPCGEMYHGGEVDTTPAEMIAFMDGCKKDTDIMGTAMWAMDDNETLPVLWDTFTSYKWDTAGTRLSAELVAFLESARLDMGARLDFYQQLYSQHKASGTLPTLNGREPVEAAVVAGVRKLLLS